MRLISRALWMLTLLTVPALVQAETMGWPEAVARLAYERTRAVTCVRTLKQYGNNAAKTQGALAYDKAKAELGAVIAGLIGVLAQDQEPASLPSLEARLPRGVKWREALCRSVVPLLPDRSNEKNVIIGLTSGVLGPLIEAVKEIYLEAREADHLTRTTIQTQLEATTWPDFDVIKP